MTPSGTSGRQHVAAGGGEEEAGGAVGDAALDEATRYEVAHAPLVEAVVKLEPVRASLLHETKGVDASSFGGAGAHVRAP
jgi:hypothetical protein